MTESMAEAADAGLMGQLMENMSRRENGRICGDALAISTGTIENWKEKDLEEKLREEMEILHEGFESAMTVMYLPESLRIFYRTSNHIERLNRELKRRSTVIGIFPDEESILRLMGNVLLEEHKGTR